MTSKFKVGDKVKVLDVSKILMGEKHYFNGMDTEVVEIDGPWVHLKNIHGEKGVSIRPNEIDAIQLIKTSKNQRITALEETVAKQGEEINELKLIVAQIRKPSTVIEEALTAASSSVEDIIEFEGAQYKKVDREACEGDVIIISKNPDLTDYVLPSKIYKVLENVHFRDEDGDLILVYNVDRGCTPETVDVYELIAEDIPSVEKSPNEKRAEIIEKAKMFIENVIERGRDSDAPNVDDGHEYYRGHYFDADFYVKNNKVTALVFLNNCAGERFKNKPDLIGRSSCAPNDVFNEHIGKAIALGRALGLDVSEFEQAVQPTEKVIGQIVSYEYTVNNKGTFEVHEIKKNGVSDEAIYDSDGCWSDDKDCKIINDTNAIYGGGE